MCTINWSLFAEMLSGSGTFFVGIAALLTLSFQFGYKLKASKLEKHLMNVVYRSYMASEAGIVWSLYPADADNIIQQLSNLTQLNKDTVKKLLDDLKDEGRI